MQMYRTASEGVMVSTSFAEAIRYFLLQHLGYHPYVAALNEGSGRTVHINILHLPLCPGIRECSGKR